MRPLFLFLLAIAQCQTTQPQEFRAVGIGFYNVENLFDTIDNPTTYDEDYTPSGKLRWTPEKFHQKIEHIGRVIARIGNENHVHGPSLLGLCEIENKHVLTELVQSPILSPLVYGFIHFEGPDRRGIDVALLYRKKHFQPLTVKRYRLELKNVRQFPIPTREQLVVHGILWDQEVTILVNHWPSRYGGRKKSAPLRVAAAQLQLRILDSIYTENPKARILVMGDFNDNPMDASVKSLTQKNTYYPHFKPLQNPLLPLSKKGIGSLAHRDLWHLFDQILLSSRWYDDPDFFFLTAKVYNPKWLQTPLGRFKGYPFRSRYSDYHFSGFSDHFPVYVLLALRQ